MPVNPELLVSKGLLPENIPPVFTAKRIWPTFTSDATAYSVTRSVVGELCLYNASKRGGQRRVFGIPHPTFVRDQAVFFEKHWADLELLFAASPGSASKPSVDIVGARHVRITPHRDLPKLRLRCLSRFRYCLVTDVSRFYPSVYTHSFPWALNGKAIAKSDTQSNSSAVFGNRLDFIIRQGQSKQTVGMPIGPDVSKIAAEILMSAVDRHFISLSGRTAPSYLRHVDDYWIGGNTYEECEKHLQNLRLALKEFELALSETKTRIVSAKLVFGETWPSEFEKEIRECLAPFNRGSDPIATFGKIIERASHDNDDGIIKHALRVIDDNKLWSRDWDIVEHFLAQCAVQFPHSFDYVARVISWRIRTKKEFDKRLWVEITRSTLLQSAQLGRDSECVWALWLLKELRQSVTTTLSDALLKNCSALVLCFLAHFPKHKLASDKNLYNRLCNAVEGNPHAGQCWPLTLELTHLDKADPAWLAVSTPPALRGLHDAKVSIIDWNALPHVFVESRRGGDFDGVEDDPDYAIEDYGADYGDSEREHDDVDDIPL